jgi:arsenate reductase-like glutaredoxin family protein
MTRTIFKAEGEEKCLSMNMSAESAKNDLKCCRRSMKETQGYAVPSATRTNPRRCSPHSAPAPQKARPQGAPPTLPRDIAEAHARESGTPTKMGIQIFGTIKCQETRKAERYFKERRIPFQFIDLSEKGLSKGELNSVKAAIGIGHLINREGKEYAKRNLSYLTHSVEEELLNHPLLFKTPIVRNGSKATVGYRPDVWKEWVEHTIAEKTITK